MSSFHGAFIFRNQGNGILSSTYLNSADPKPYPETCILKSGGQDDDLFIGVYETLWLEKGGSFKCTLEINKNTFGSYDLRWFKGNKTEFEGLGVFENGILVGCYWDI